MSDPEPPAHDDVVIPDLNTRRKERRRSGAAYFQGPQAQATGLAAVVTGEGYLGLQRAIGDFSSAATQALQRVLALLDKVPAAFTEKAIGLFWVGMTALALYVAFHKPAPRRAGPELEVASASVRPHPASESVRLKFAGQSAGGLIAWARPWNSKEAPKKQAAASAAAGAADAAPGDSQKEAEPTDWASILGSGAAGGGKPETAHAAVLNSGALSTALGGSWGDKNVFANFNAEHPAAPRPTLGSRLRAAVTGAMSSFTKSGSRQATRAKSVRRASSKSAFGQLTLTQRLSSMGAAATNLDTMKSLASDAFDQSATSGGTVAPDTVSKIPTVTPMGAGAPNMTLPDAPDVTPVNMTPYQGLLDKAMQMIQTAAMLKMLGMLLVLVGGILLAMGLGLIPNPFTFAAGMALKIAGLAMIAMGLFMLYTSAQLAAAAKQIGQQIQSMQGQMTQNNIVDECATQANQNGTALADCKHDEAPEMKTSIKQDVDKERNASWTWDDENGNPNKPAPTH